MAAAVALPFLAGLAAGSALTLAVRAHVVTLRQRRARTGLRGSLRPVDHRSPRH